jgi:hypothetical protein
MGLSGWMDVGHTSHLYCSVCKSVCHMSKGKEETSRNSERKLEAEAKHTLRTSLYIQSTLKGNLHREFYILLISLS